jgi:hypothetical protein
MALLSEGMRDKEFDVRIVARKLNKGQILADEVEKYEKKLADDTDNAEYVNLDATLEGVRGKSGLR